MLRHLTIAVLVASALALTACSVGGGESDLDLGTADVVLVADDMVYPDAPTELPSGPITIALDNQGNATHDIMIADTKVAQASGGRGDIGEVDLEPGTYEVWCSIAGHRDAGMLFEVTVR